MATGRCGLDTFAHAGLSWRAVARELEKYLKTGSGIATLRRGISASEVCRT